MHAYLFVGKDKEALNTAVEEKAAELHLKTQEYTVNKIGDVRQLTHTLSISQDAQTGFVIRDIDQATEEAVNAFLKNLEEPQKGVYFLLTARNEQDVLSTIRSRCEVVHVIGHTNTETDIFLNFYSSGISQKLTTVDAIKKRDEALAFIETLITEAHAAVLSNKVPPVAGSLFLREAEKVRYALEANGNVSLQLSNFVFRIS